MNIPGLISFAGLFMFCLVSLHSHARELTSHDTLKQDKPDDTLTISKLTGKIIFRQELEYSLSMNSLFFINWLHDKNANQLNLLQHLKYRSVLDNNLNFSFSNCLVHNLGLQYYFDSVSKFYPDDNTMSTRLELKIKSQYNLIFTSTLLTRCFPGYDYYITDSGKLIKTLSSSFLTPLIWNLSLGVGLTWKDYGSLSMGVSSAKLTYLRDKRIFDLRKVDNYCGVAKGKNHLFEYGLSMQLLVNKDLLKWFHWDCDLSLFKNYKTSVDLTLKNLFGIRINKFLKTTIQTSIFYEEKICKTIQLENLVAIGFYFNL